MAAVARSLDTTIAIATYVCDYVTAALVGRDAVRYVVRAGRLVLMRPDVGELCVARKPCWKGRCVTLSRGLRPVTSPPSCHVLDISARGSGCAASCFITPLASSLDADLHATGAELLALMSAVSGVLCTAPLIVTFEDFTHVAFQATDVVILTAPGSSRSPPGLAPRTRTRSLPAARTAR